MIARPFDIEAARRRAVYGAAKLALLKVQALQNIERTDTSARKVEEALARVAEVINDELIIPAISRIADDLRNSDPDALN